MILVKVVFVMFIITDPIRKIDFTNACTYVGISYIKVVNIILNQF